MLDQMDKKIIELVQEDGRIPFSRISEKVGISHVAVKRRLDKLEENGWLSISTGLNGEKLDLKIAVVTAEIENYDRVKELLDQYEECPRTIFLSSIGGSKILAILVAEDLTTLDSVLGTCSLRTKEGVRRSTVEIGVSPRYPLFLPLRIRGEKRKRNSPCGETCRKCNRLLEEKCLGCPATIYYEGSLF